MTRLKNSPKKGQKVLIIKLGYSETLDSGISTQCSLGDVLRTTAILHHFKNDSVTWLTDNMAFPLLNGNPYIKRILFFDLMSVLLLLGEEFDVVVNLEKVPALCALAERVKAWRRYGFRLDSHSGKAEAYEHAYNALYISSHMDIKKQHGKPWLEILFEMLGKPYRGENYILGYKPCSKEKFDIGFNIHVGSKWANKAWPEKHWKELEKALIGRYSVSWQKGMSDMKEYIDWVNSCRLLVTNDSLGLHLAIALNKKVVAIFGPTIHQEIHPARGLIKLVPLKKKFPCSPCIEMKCRFEGFKHCMDTILPPRILGAIEKLCPQ